MVVELLGGIKMKDLRATIRRVRAYTIKTEHGERTDILSMIDDLIFLAKANKVPKHILVQRIEDRFEQIEVNVVGPKDMH